MHRGTNTPRLAAMAVRRRRRVQATFISFTARRPQTPPSRLMAPRPLPQPAVQLSSTTTPARGTLLLPLMAALRRGAVAGSPIFFFWGRKRETSLLIEGPKEGWGGGTIFGGKYLAGETKNIGL